MAQKINNDLELIPDHADIACVYGFLSLEDRAEVRRRCELQHNIPQTTFWWYLRTNRIPEEKREVMRKEINLLLNEKGFHYG